MGFNNISNNNNLNIEAEKSYHNLTACIECYACLHNCPLHKLNDLKLSQKKKALNMEIHFLFLKLQRKYLDPLTPDVERANL